MYLFCIQLFWISTASDGCGINSMKPVRDFHDSMQSRLQAANRYVEEAHACGTVLCDSINNQALELYQAFPDRLVVIKNGVIVHDGGPSQTLFYNVDSVINWLLECYPEAKELMKPTSRDETSQECSS